MASPFAIYGLATEDLAPALTPAVSSGTADPDYPATNLGNGADYEPFKATTTSVDVDWDLGAATQLGLVVLRHTNLTGATVQWKTNAASDFSGAGDTVAVALPAADPDGYRDNPWSDFRAITARRYLRLHVSGNATPVIVGGVWIGTGLHQLVRGHQPNVDLLDRRFDVQGETVTGARWYYDWGVRERGVQRLTVLTRKDDAGGALRDVYLAARGRSRPWPLVLDAGTNSAIIVNFDQPAGKVTRGKGDSATVSFQLRESSRGEAWG